MAQYSESVLCEAKPQIETETGLIRGVKILGENSVNGRRYPRSVREKARAKYEGARVNVDHPVKGESVERSFRDWVGNIENVRVESDGTFGDLRLRKQHPDFSSIVEAAESFHKHFGLSHVAECDSKRVGGVSEVTEIRDVISVDIVTDPATTKGLTESRNRRMAAKPRTIKQVAEGLAESPIRTVLMEMAAEGTMADAIVEPPAAEAEPEPVDQETVAALVAAIKALLSARYEGKSTGDEGKTNQPPAEGGAKQEPPPMAESKEVAERLAALEAENRSVKARNLLIESNREATDIRVKSLAAAESDADRKALLESWPVKAESNVRESRRPGSSPPASGDGGSAKDGQALFKEHVERSKAARERRLAAR